MRICVYFKVVESTERVCVPALVVNTIIRICVCVFVIRWEFSTGEARNFEEGFYVLLSETMHRKAFIKTHFIPASTSRGALTQL